MTRDRPDRPMSLAIGPANYAGQAYEWAEATRRELGVPAISFVRRPSQGADPFRFSVHEQIGTGRGGNPWPGAEGMDEILERATHVLADGFLPLWGSPRWGSLRRDLRRLAGRDLSVGLISHGSDTRDPDRHMQMHDFSYYSDAPASYVWKLRRRAQANRRLAVESAVPWFVSTPDLLMDAPTATWLPVTIDPAAWTSTRPALRDGKPRFLHVPSRRQPPIKGTVAVEAVLPQLERRGRLEYVNPSTVPHESMPSWVLGVDVVIDQLQSGFYGVAAVEAMAAGRLVIGNVSDETRALMPEAPPIVDATPTTLGEVVSLILESPDHYAALAERGPGFVARWHSGRAAARAIATFLEVSG